MRWFRAIWFSWGEPPFFSQTRKLSRLSSQTNSIRFQSGFKIYFFCVCRGIIYALGSSSVISIIKVSWSARTAAGSVWNDDADIEPRHQVMVRYAQCRPVHSQKDSGIFFVQGDDHAT